MKTLLTVGGWHSRNQLLIDWIGLRQFCFGWRVPMMKPGGLVELFFGPVRITIVRRMDVREIEAQNRRALKLRKESHDS